MATYKIGKGRYTLPTGLPQDVLEQAIEEIYATHEATRQGSLGYSVDNAQKMLGKGTEAFGRFTGIDAVENYGSDVVAQQEKDLEEGRYVSDYQGSFTDQDGAFKKLGWAGEKIVENLATSGVALGGSVATLAAGAFSAPAAFLIGGGTLATNLVMSTGEAALEAEDKTGDYSAGGAIATGGIVAFLDRFGAKIPKDKIANMTGRQLVDELVAKGYTNAASELVKTVTKKAVKEGATEAAQENVIMTGAALQGGDYSLGEVINKNIDSFVVGAGMGAGQSVASGGVKSLIGTGDDVAGEPIQQETAAASFALRLDKIANEGQPTDDGPVPFDLNDVDRMSDNGARAVMDVAHTRIATEIKEVSKVLRDKLSGKERAEFEKELGSLGEYVEIKDNDVVLSAAELRSSKNKTKSAITTGGYNAVNKLVGDKREGQELLNLLRESQMLTSLHNKGYVGGLSQYTEGLNPFKSNTGYGDRSSIESVSRIGLSAAGGYATGGATIGAQLGAVGGARAVDAMTGSRSRVNKFVNQNKDGAPLTSSGPSLREEQFQEQQAEDATFAQEEAQKQAQAESDAQQQSQNAQETAEANRVAGQRNAPPTLESPQWTMETATGLDKNGVAMALRMLERLPSTPVAIRKAIDGYRKTVDTGGKVPNLSPLIRFVNSTANDNSQFIQRVAQPDTGVEQQQVQVDKTEAYKQTEGYRRGIEANQKAGSDLSASMNADKSISRIDKAKLGNAIQQLQLNLGENPLQAVQSIVSDLSKSGISQELLQKYIAPYADRVARQQPKPDVPTFDDRVSESGDARLARAKDQGFDTNQVYYHGTYDNNNEGFTSLDPSLSGSNNYVGMSRLGTWLESNPEGYALVDERGANTVYPVFIRGRSLTFKKKNENDVDPFEQLSNRLEIETGVKFEGYLPEQNPAVDEYVQQLVDEGYSHITLVNTDADKAWVKDGKPRTWKIMLEPKDMRSVNAKFDPSKQDSSLILDDRTKTTPSAESDPFNIGKDMGRTILGMYPTEGATSPFTVKTKVEGIKKLFSELYGKTTGTTDPIEQAPENVDTVAKTIATEAMRALEEDSTAIGWYDRVLDRAMTILEMTDPDVSATPELETTFKYGLAVTSNGQAVDDNFKYAVDVFNFFKQNGRLPETKKEFKQGGKNNTAMLQSFKFFNAYTDVHNRGGVEESLQEFLAHDFRRGDLDKYIKGFNQEHGTKLSVGTSESVDTMIKGSYVMGPKIGQGFYQNLTGNYDPLTTDIWWMRMFNRHIGRPLEPRKSEAHMKKSKATIVDKIKSAKKGSMQFDLVKDALNVLGEKKAGLYADNSRLTPFLKQLQKSGDKWYKQYAKDNGVNPTFEKGNLYTLVKTYNANTVDQPQEAPSGPKERQFMRQVTSRALELLATQGIDITTADFQALMWYPEKRLFKMIGVKSGNGSDNDYEDAARLLASKQGISNEQIEKTLSKSGRGADGVSGGAVSRQQDGGTNTGTRSVDGSTEAIPALTIPTYDDFSGPEAEIKDFPPVSKVHFAKAKEVLSGKAFNIGKDGDPLEHGVNDPYVLSLVARTFDTTIEYVSNQSDLDAVSDLYNRKRMPYNQQWSGKFIPNGDVSLNVKENYWGYIRSGGGVAIVKEADANDQMRTATHEAGHGITMYTESGEFDKAMKNPINNRKGPKGRPESIVQGSFQGYFFETIMAKPKKERDAFIKEITYVQQELMFSTKDMRDQGESTPFRVAGEFGGYKDMPYGEGMRWKRNNIKENLIKRAGLDIKDISAEKLRSLDNNKTFKKLMKDATKDDTEYERGYLMDYAESIVDPFMYILTDPKQAKKDIPKFYKLAKDFFNSSGGPLKFFSALLALVIATEEEEEERNVMAQGALSPQGQGALAMV